LDSDYHLGLLASVFTGSTVITPSADVIVALILAALLVIVSAFISASESAFMALSPDEIKAIRACNSRKDVRLAAMLDDAESLQATIMLSNNFVNVMVVLLCNYAFGRMFDFSSPVLQFVLVAALVFFLLLLGWFVFYAFRYRWLPALSWVLALVFSLPNLLKPELHTQGLMPVLQSFWFIPHVILYIFAYSLLAISFLLSIYGLSAKKGRGRLLLEHIDRLSRLGTLCLLTGICLGCVWAKQAWGSFWTWDPKETWALATLLCYGISLGLRRCPEHPVLQQKASLWFQILGFITLQICWYGINYLPATQNSLHVYG